MTNKISEQISGVVTFNGKAFSLQRFFAFTLAETLIVMGIIGVVAALTIPNLNSSTNDKEKVAKVMKIYSNLQDAYGRATSVYGPIDEWFQNDSNISAQSTRFGERMLDFMKPTKVCKVDVGCFSNSASYFFDGDKMEDHYASSLKSDNTYMAILSDGTSIGFLSQFGGNIGKIRVDIDGPSKGKNTLGVDIFDFSIALDDDLDDPKGELVPSCHQNTRTGNLGTNIFNYETAWVVRNGNMDYLKLDSSYKCPNGNYLNWETKTTCK